MSTPQNTAPDFGEPWKFKAREILTKDNDLIFDAMEALAAALVAKAMQDEDLKRAIARGYPENCLEDGFPESWLASYRQINNPLGLAA